tara:strand:- start:188 stop:841 length:654 start_codon:yes stop_codon:yes gene_type:complete
MSMNILVVCDLSWDNYAEISKRLTSTNIDPTHRINIFYGKQMKHISNICNKNMLQIFRKSLNDKTLVEDLCNSLTFSKCCIIFHNFTEYNTISELCIKMCEKNGIPYFIFSEHTSNFFYNGEQVSKFKKYMTNVPENSERNIINFIPDFEISLPVIKTNVEKDYSTMVQKLRNSYRCIDEIKSKKSIIYVDNKTPKEYSYLEYLANRKKWLKEIIPR